MESLNFAQEFDKFKGEHRILGYNGLVVVEVNDLPTYERAVEIRDLAKKMPETLKEIHELLKHRYANYDPKTTYQKLGRALSDQSFNFDTDRRASGHIYLLAENG